MAEPFAFVKDRNFRAYVRVLVRRHQLLAEGKEDSDYAELLEGRMSELWERLDDTQRQEMRGISSDLNWLRRGYLPAPKGRRKEDISKAETDEFLKLLEAWDILPLLHSMRACAPALNQGVVAMARARCYLSLGLDEVSEPFLKATIDLAQNRSEAARSAFVMLIHVSPAGAFQKATEVIASPDKYPPVIVAFAIQFFLEFVGEEVPPASRNELVKKMLAAATRLDDEPTPREDQVLFFSLVGAQLMAFGLVDDSIKFLEQGLQLEPENADLLAWLGEALYNKDRTKAVELLNQSISSGTKLVRPYLHLANHFLVGGDFVLAQAYAAHAADRARDSFSLGVALEIMAISLSEQRAPHDLVLGLLRRAAKLAPDNKRIEFNLAAFEKFVQSKSVPATWETQENREVSESRERWRVRLPPEIFEPNREAASANVE